MAHPTRFVVTGSSSGIGRALCRELLRRSCHVVGMARRAQAPESLDADQAQRFLALSVDVADDAALASAMTQAAEHLGGIDAVVANAGMGIPATIDTLRIEDVRRVLEVNVVAAIRTLQLALPHVRRSEAPLLCATTSLAGWRAGPGAAPYCASKAALSAFLDSLRAELAAERIPVLDIAPGFVRSAMTDRNAFAMPLLMESDAAARVMADALLARRSHLAFPWRLAALIWLARRLPDRLYDRLSARVAAKLRREGALGVAKAARQRE